MNKKHFYIAVAVALVGGVAATVVWISPKQEKFDGGTVGEFWGTIIGTVSLGPTCPVVMDPPDPQCADKPYATSLVVTTPDGARVMKTFSSDVAGKFSIEVPPGEYAIRSAAAANILPYCSHDRFTVEANEFTELTVSCDTGIR